MSSMFFFMSDWVLDRVEFLLRWLALEVARESVAGSSLACIKYEQASANKEHLDSWHRKDTSDTYTLTL
jgi:hypothetical protein